jgi:hypothetical protein
MEKDEPEVVHLEWERVQDPTREPPPELVVAEPEPPKRRILPRGSDPNPFRPDAPPMGSVAEFLSLLFVLLIVAVGTMLWGALRGN